MILKSEITQKDSREGDRRHHPLLVAAGTDYATVTKPSAVGFFIEEEATAEMEKEQKRLCVLDRFEYELSLILVQVFHPFCIEFDFVFEIDTN
ncbi:hypothetical protein L1887_08941 [Cichorium endivia]|nr:hypothetical protein L1887_08941 [Cichorium endivia]